MRRTIIPLLLLGFFAIGGSQLPSVTAQLRTTGSAPLPGPALSSPYSELQNPLSTGTAAPLRPDGLAPVPVQPYGPMAPAMASQSPQFFQGMADIRPRDPRIAELTERYNQLEQQVMQMAREFRQMRPEGQEREPLRQKIAEVTQEQFQIRHQVRQLDIERLQNQLKELQEKLQRREEMKDYIINRRVAQLTEEDDELRWDPMNPSGGGMAMSLAVPQPPMLTAPGLPGSYYPPPVLAPRTADPLGQMPGGRASNPAEDLIPPATPSNLPPVTPGSPPPAMGPTSVREAEARLDIAQRELEQIKAQFDAGMIHMSEFSRAEGAVRLAQIAAETARQDQQARIKMLELDLRKTEAEFAAAGAELDALSQTHERDRNAVTEVDIRKAKAGLAEKQVELERAKTMLEFQLQRAKKPE